MMDQFTCVTPTHRTLTRFQEVPKYPEGLYDLGHHCYAWMVPNGSWGEANAGLILGEDESLLVDTLWDVPFTHEMLAAMQPLTDQIPLKYTVNTHADGDHFFGNELIKQTDIITSGASLREMMTTQPKSMALLGTIGKLLSGVGRLPGLGQHAKVGHWFQGMVKPYAFGNVQHTPAQRTFEGELTLTVGGRKVQLIEIGPMHTHGDLMVYVPNAKILYSADALFIGSTPVMWAGPLENWIKALDKMLSMDVDVIVPGHGPITNKDGVTQVKSYWEYVDREVRARYQKGMSAQAAARDIALSVDFLRQPFAKWNSPERIMVSTHTHYRHLQGRIDPPKVPEVLNNLRKQALLAHEMMDAEPQVMRKR